MKDVVLDETVPTNLIHIFLTCILFFYEFSNFMNGQV
jgi:hypothetical protein